MQWHFKKLNYDILVPKLDKSIFDLSEEETDIYFKWFMEQIPVRIEYISQVCARELRIPIEYLDCSPESLRLLWKWFLKRAKTEPAIPIKDMPPALVCSIPKKNRQLTLETEYIIRDIGTYLGETFRKNLPQIYWTYYTKPINSIFVNHPLLKGFVDVSPGAPPEIEFEPIHMAGIQARKILSNNANDTDLLNIYNIWAKKI